MPCRPGARGRQVSAFIPIVYGCSYACTFCIIPYKRGVERSRPPEEILAEARSLVAQGVREITLLGQIVDRYGKDQPEFPTLAGLLRRLHEIEGLERLRFLTSHPNYMTDELLDLVGDLPKVMPHIEVPVQAGDDEVLANMHRGYTVEQYRRLVEKLRRRIPGVSIATDIIVGFPGETEEQFQHTYDLLAELKLDVAHLARYSSRPGTVATRRMEDNVAARGKNAPFPPVRGLAGADCRRDPRPPPGTDRSGAFRGKGQKALARAHPHQQAGLRGNRTEPAQPGAAGDHPMDRPVVDDREPGAKLKRNGGLSQR